MRGARLGISADLEVGRTYVRRRRWPALPPVLQPFPVFSAEDPGTFSRLAAPLLGQLRVVDRDDRPGRFRASLHAVVIGSVTLGYLHTHTATVLELSASARRFLVLEPSGPSTSVHCAAATFDAAPGIGVVVQPGRPTTMRCGSDAGHLVVGIEQPTMVTHANRLLGHALDQPLVFEPRLDLASCGASRWNLGVEMLEAELAEPASLLQAGIGHVQLEEFLMSALLYGHHSTCSMALKGAGEGGERRATAAAKQFIETNLSERLPLPDIAAAAGVSVRTLQAAFRSELRTTPVAYIRSRRLDRVRAELAGGAGTLTVTDVATRWGITHLGRFAAEYRARFGESPSETLRRHRQAR